MIEAHVLDSWSLRSERATAAFGYLNLLGGFAAPLFLWLAGVSVALAAEQAHSRTGDRTAAGKALIRRGLEIFVLAFLFRTQSFIVSPGNPLVSLLRVDILNIMGPSLMGAAFVWWIAGGARRAAAACAAVASLVALVTPVVRTASWLHVLPPVVQWYVSPAGNHSTFTLFPWAGFVFAGAAYGALLALPDRLFEGRTLRRLAAAGALVVVGSYLASLRPSIYPASSFWTTSPTYFGIRAGGMMIAMAGLYALTPLSRVLPAPFAVLARLGRHSLFVYWIHVELVYGYASALIHRQLSLPINALAYLCLCAMLYWSLGLRDRVVGWWRVRRVHGPTPQTLNV